MTNKDYSHIKQGMYVLKEEIKDEETWRAVKDAFVGTGKVLDYDYASNSEYMYFKDSCGCYYGLDSHGDLFLGINLEDYKEPIQVSVDFILGRVSKEEEGDIKVGDYVEVVNIGKIYTTYQEMADKMGLDNYLSKEGVRPSIKEVYKVVGLKKHLDNLNTLVLGIEAQDGKHYLIGIEGVKKVDKPEEEDGTMFKVGEVYQCGESQVKVVYITEDKAGVVGIELNSEGSEISYVGLWYSDTGAYDYDNYEDLSYDLEPIKDNTETLKEIEELKERIKQLEGTLQ